MKQQFYPFSAVVGQETMKEALLLNVINPSIGGVLIQGEKGTAKTTAVRGLTKLMDEGAKVVELPVGASEDRVVGSINIKNMMKKGEKEFEPGLLKEADGNILYVDEINLLDDHIVDILLDSAATGMNYVERDGISYSHPSRFVLVGTMNPEEGTLRPQLLDRFGLFVQVGSTLSPEERGEVIRRRLQFESNPESFIEKYEKEEQELRKRIKKGKEILSKQIYTDDLIDYCSTLCAKMEVDGYRADITMMKTGATIAALNGRTEMNQDDLLKAARLVLPHRMKRRPFEEKEMTEDMLEEAKKEAENRGKISKKKQII